MKGIVKLLVIFLSLFMMSVNVYASTVDVTLYDIVKTGEIKIYYDDSEDIYVTTTYRLRELKDDGDEAYDYYILETNSYFNTNGNELEITHSTNNAAIIFESADFDVTRLMGNENRFLTFFSKFNNYTKVNCRMIEDSENIWTYTRQIYAVNRYFDNSYTFKNMTAFRVMENKEVHINLKVDGSFSEGDFKHVSESIVYDSLKQY
ncbi:MAG: hypothetical protein IKM20_05800 [Erysipelotrichales bacterium]|nr:hypothetical protein [Erysipelotrichales bacterium]